MFKFLTFPKGGVHPNDKKFIAKNEQIEVMPRVKLVKVSLAQHLGAPATPQVAVGDLVEEGQLIATASSFISANIHSPVKGKVTKIEKLVTAVGSLVDAIFIERDEEADKRIYEKRDPSDFDAAKIVSIIQEYGIVGLGGAAFPTNVKFSLPKGKVCEYLIVNSVECEPYITSDYRIAKERKEEVFKALALLRKALDAKHVHIGIEANKMDVVKEFSEYSQSTNQNVVINPLKLKYPQGDEKQLIKAITKREVPSGKLPIDVGAVVVNISSVYAMYEALFLDKPLYERVVTVTGEMVNSPKNVLCSIGTSVSEIIEYCQGLKEGANKVILGGPMMGFAQCSLDTTITKNTGSILVMKAEPVKTYPCIRCGECVNVCPMGLSPLTLNHLYQAKESQLAVKKYNAMDCKECGCCSYACPSHINLVQAIRMNKRLGRS